MCVRSRRPGMVEMSSETWRFIAALAPQLYCLVHVASLAGEPLGKNLFDSATRLNGWQMQCLEGLAVRPG